MSRISRLKLFIFGGVVVLGPGANTSHAQTKGQPAPGHPAVTIKGQTFTPRSISARNMPLKVPFKRPDLGVGE